MILEELEQIVSSALGISGPIARIGGFLGRSEVYAVGDAAVLKVFFHAAETKWRREVDAYAFLRGKGLPVPALLGSGRTAVGVPWILIERLPGRPAADLLLAPDSAEAATFYRDAGRLAGRLHALDVGALAASDGERSTIRAVERYRRYAGGVVGEGRPRAALLAAARSRMDGLEREILSQSAPTEAFTHGDFCSRNLLLVSAPTGYRISGLIDFEKAKLADRVEDLGRTVLYDTYWHPHLGASLLRGYGEIAALPHDLADRLLLHLIGFAFEVASWAFDKDRGHFDRVTDILDDLVTTDGAALRALVHAAGGRGG